MFDNIHLHQISSPSSPATRIKPLEQRQGNMQNGGFKKCLKEEEEEDKKKEKKKDSKASGKAKKDMNANKLTLSNTDDHLEPDSGKTYNEHGKSKFIDIVV